MGRNTEHFLYKFPFFFLSCFISSFLMGLDLSCQLNESLVRLIRFYQHPLFREKTSTSQLTFR